MDPIAAVANLPPRLRRALLIWCAFASMAGLLPAAGRESVGLLAHPAFWCGLLPLIALVPWMTRWRPARAPRPRRRRQGAQARRRGRAAAKVTAQLACGAG